MIGGCRVLARQLWGRGEVGREGGGGGGGWHPTVFIICTPLLCPFCFGIQGSMECEMKWK